MAGAGISPAFRETSRNGHFSPCAVAGCLQRTFLVPRCQPDSPVAIPPISGRESRQRMRRIIRSLRCPPVMFGITALCYRSVSSGPVRNGFPALLPSVCLHTGRGGCSNEPGKMTRIWEIRRSDNLSRYHGFLSVRYPLAAAPPPGTVMADGNGCHTAWVFIPWICVS